MNQPTLPEHYRPPIKMHGRVLRTCRGLDIGGAIPPRMPDMGGDAQLIQLALLEPRTAKPLPLIKRAAGAIWRWA